MESKSIIYCDYTIFAYIDGDVAISNCPVCDDFKTDTEIHYDNVDKALLAAINNVVAHLKITHGINRKKLL